MKYLYLALSWIFGALLLLAGLLFLYESLIGAVCIILMSFLLLPPIRQFFFSKTNIAVEPKIRIALLTVLIVTFSVAIVQESDVKSKSLADKDTVDYEDRLAQVKQENLNYFNANRESVIAEASLALEEKDYEKVKSVAFKYWHSGDAELKRIQGLADEALAIIKKEKRTEALLAELKTIPASDFDENLIRYKELQDLHPDNTRYENKRVHYQAKIDEREKARKAQEKELLAKKARTDNIKSQFSSWDGSHRNLERLIKETMNDPDSYDHAETVYWDKGDHLIVKTTFRGKNAFGGVVKNFVTAKVSLNGAILEIIDQT